MSNQEYAWKNKKESNETHFKILLPYFLVPFSELYLNVESYPAFET